MVKFVIALAFGLLSINWGASASAQGQEHIFYIQTKLNNAGFEAGEPDGIAGRRTLGALAEMGASMGFEATPEAMLSFFQKRYYRVAEPITNERNLAAVKRPLEDVLLDPYSAKYKDIVIMPTGNICGYVNAKNRFGAYVGYRRFFALSIFSNVFSDGDLHVFSAQVDGEDSNRAEYFCILDMDFSDRN